MARKSNITLEPFGKNVVVVFLSENKGMVQKISKIFPFSKQPVLCKDMTPDFCIHNIMSCD